MTQPSNVSWGGDLSELKLENIKLSGSLSLHVTNQLNLKGNKNWVFYEAYVDTVHIV